MPKCVHICKPTLAGDPIQAVQRRASRVPLAPKSSIMTWEGPWHLMQITFQSLTAAFQTQLCATGRLLRQEILMDDDQDFILIHQL